MFKYYIKTTLILILALFLTSGLAVAEKKGKKDPAVKAEKQQKKAEKAADETDDDKGVSFANLKSGQKVKSPLKVKMLVSGKKVAPAGDPAPDTGHFHIIIDGDYLQKGKLVPADAKHIHYGLGQTEAEVKLEKGKHKLTLQFADKDHISYGKKWAQSVEVIVE